LIHSNELFFKNHLNEGFNDSLKLHLIYHLMNQHIFNESLELND